MDRFLDMEKLKSSNPSAALRLERLLKKLEEAYPDRKVTGLTKQHKKWAESLTTLRRELGYPDNESLLSACGFQYEKSLGGRPVSTSCTFIDELKKRYPNGSPFSKMADLLTANPDLKSKTKTMVNNAPKKFGMPLGAYLHSIGILQEPSACQKEPTFGLEVEKVIADIQKCYEGHPLPETVDQLFQENRQLSRSQMRRAAEAENCTLKEFLLSHGMLQVKAAVKPRPEERKVYTPEQLEQFQKIVELLDNSFFLSPDLRIMLNEIADFDYPVSLEQDKIAVTGTHEKLLRDAIKAAGGKTQQAISKRVNCLVICARPAPEAISTFLKLRLEGEANHLIAPGQVLRELYKTKSIDRSKTDSLLLPTGGFRATPEANAYFLDLMPAPVQKEKDARDSVQTDDSIPKEPTRISDWLCECPYPDVIQKAAKTGTKIHYAGQQKNVSMDEIGFVLSEYAMQWEKHKSVEIGNAFSKAGPPKIEVLKSAQGIRCSKTADAIVQKLNRKELDSFLHTLGNGVNYRVFLLAYARFATEKEVKDIVEKIGYQSKGHAKERYWATSMENALMLNPTVEAMQYFDKKRLLSDYARVQGLEMSNQEIRDVYMMPQFQVDEDGVKRYDIGGNTIEVRIGDDLSCQLFDVKNQKLLRSMPKKSDDEKKLAACTAAYATFKKEIQEFYKQQLAKMHTLHVEGTAITEKNWREVYTAHPFLKYLTRLLVWQDETENSFIPTVDGVIDQNGKAYEPQGKISLAHVLSLSHQEVCCWQERLTLLHITQPFAQMNEPVVPWKTSQIYGRYQGVFLSRTLRNRVKKELAAWGVPMCSEKSQGWFDPYQYKYVFSDEGTLDFASCYWLKYTVNEESDGITLGEGNLASNPAIKTVRVMNAVLLQLDFATASSCVEKDLAEDLSVSYLELCPSAQLDELLECAEKNRSVQCKQRLLKIKMQRADTNMDR